MPVMPLDISAQVKKLLPWIVAIAFFMQSLDATILNIALPSMATDLNVNPLQMQSAIIAYMLTVALVIPVCGWISDRFGTKKVFFFAVALFTLGSIFCAAAWSLPILVIGRIIQGLGGALMMPVGRLVILKVYPRSEFVKVMSFVTIPGLLGPLLGPTVGGWLVEYFSWHWIFLINVPMGILGCFVACKFMPDLRGAIRTKFDFIGFILFGTAMIMISFALEGLSEIHLPASFVTLLFILGFSCFIGYWWHAFRIEFPLFPPSLFKIRSFSIGILGNLFARLGNGSLPFLIPLLLQLALGYSPAEAGMMMIPTALCAILSKSLVRHIINFFGYRWVLTVNTLLLGLLICSFSWVDKEMPFLLLLAMLGATGAINSLQFTAMNTVALFQLDDDLASSGNALLSVVVQLSISFGVAISAILLAYFNGGQPAVDSIEVLPAFQGTFLGVGLFTVFSAVIFYLLPTQIGMTHKK
ncbi:multidrug transporter subunit MdtD [Entomomonas asaccharolytica]|uniref:Multidrug transporter subunit MdtD n=1 Tax=Entomomonas asaccharolytica TaxID=2785331 RepID=A0A974RWN2_9GAMM|nr:multidrug transporter subunit MdtD [Entomomonas asaccharolytica]QQP85386.1 multidrug transporter subunit MdtD [Entomomonas asaccharolytica]